MTLTSAHVFIQTKKGGISGAGVKVARAAVQVKSVYTSGLQLCDDRRRTVAFLSAGLCV